MTPAVFRKKVMSYYRRQGRSFPWRPPLLKLQKGKADPYKVLVSEIMLQQTQTFRVVPKYEAFLKALPTVEALAKAPLPEVLALWQGLGYNRRAKYLHEAAKVCIRLHAGQVPQTYEELRKLPGVGDYTAKAVLAFAYNKPLRQTQGEPVVMIETNIRAALIHEFFPKAQNVSDARLLPILARVVAGSSSPRELYYALMDYGAFIKSKFPNPSRRSAHHVKQSKFEGSDRQIRGAIIRVLTDGKMSEGEMKRSLDKLGMTAGGSRVKGIMAKLVREGLVEKHHGRYAIPI